jgi:hypothetical protein
MQNMESDVTKNRLSTNMANNQVSGNLHANAGQGSSLDNHNWKPMDTEDTQTTINQVQEMVGHSVMSGWKILNKSLSTNCNS